MDIPNQTRNTARWSRAPHLSKLTTTISENSLADITSEFVVSKMTGLTAMTSIRRLKFNYRYTVAIEPALHHRLVLGLLVVLDLGPCMSAELLKYKNGFAPNLLEKWNFSLNFCLVTKYRLDLGVRVDANSRDNVSGRLFLSFSFVFFLNFLFLKLLFMRIKM